jgi:phosphatidylglycerol:prolipoprotein diacylglycerol transferase
VFPVVNLFGLQISTYLLLNSFVFSLSVIWIFFRAPKFKLNRSDVLDVTFSGMVGAFIGARLFHVFFERPEFYFANPSYVFKFWYGGFVFYGGLIGGAVFALFACRYKKIPPLLFGDLIAPILALGYSVGRIGCFAAGCCYGSHTDVFWAVQFPQGVEAPAGIGLHPTQLYSSLWSFIGFVIILCIEKLKLSFIHKQAGRTFGIWLAFQSVGRFIVERFRDDFRGPTVFNLSISTWMSMAAFVVAVLLLTNKDKKETQDASSPPTTRIS